MTLKSRLYPIESFGPELLQALLAGSKKRLVIELPSYRLAVRMQLRLQQLRKQMRNEGHELTPLVARARTSLAWGERAGYAPVDEIVSSKNVGRPRNTGVRCKLIIEPHDSEFVTAITNAGVVVDDLKEDPLSSVVLSKLEADPEPHEGDYLDKITRPASGIANSKKIT